MGLAGYKLSWCWGKVRGALGLTQAGTSDAGNQSFPSLGAWRLPEWVAQRQWPGKYWLICQNTLLLQQQGLALGVKWEAKQIKLPLERPVGKGDDLDPNLPVDPSRGVTAEDSPGPCFGEVIEWYKITNSTQLLFYWFSCKPFFNYASFP